MDTIGVIGSEALQTYIKIDRIPKDRDLVMKYDTLKKYISYIKNITD